MCITVHLKKYKHNSSQYIAYRLKHILHDSAIPLVCTKPVSGKLVLESTDICNIKNGHEVCCTVHVTITCHLLYYTTVVITITLSPAAITVTIMWQSVGDTVISDTSFPSTQLFRKLFVHRIS